MVLKELIFNNFYFGRECSNGPERKDSSQLLPLEGMVVLKEQVLLTVPTMGVCGCLERTDF